MNRGKTLPLLPSSPEGVSGRAGDGRFRRPPGLDWSAEWEALTWYCLTVAPGREFAAREALGRAGVGAALPLRAVQARPRGRGPRRLEVRPLLPGYIFAAPGPVGWAGVLGLREVTGVVGVAGRPSRVRVTAERDRAGRVVRWGLADLMRRSCGGAMTPAGHWPELAALRAGDRAEVLDGPLGGWVVEVASVDAARGSARVVTSLLGGREAKVSLDALVRV